MQVQSTNPFTTSAASTAAGASSTTSSGSSTGSGSSTSGSSSTVTESMFLQLLIAQMKNQDPTSPQDPTQFVGELAQFSELEQTIGINTNTATLVTDLAPATTTPTTTPTAPPATTTTPAA